MLGGHPDLAANGKKGGVPFNELKKNQKKKGGKKQTPSKYATQHKKSPKETDSERQILTNKQMGAKLDRNRRGTVSCLKIKGQEGQVRKVVDVK